MRWLWLKEIDPSWPWSMFHIQVHKSIHTSFSMASVQWCWGWHLIFAWQVDSWPVDSLSCMTSFVSVTREEQTRGFFLCLTEQCLGLRHPRYFDSRCYHWIPCTWDIFFRGDRWFCNRMHECIRLPFLTAFWGWGILIKIHICWFFPGYY